MKYTIYKPIRSLCRFLLKILYRVEYIGRENIPSKGSVILAGNHTNFKDGALMISGPDRIVHTLAKKEIFEKKFFNWFFRNMGCIPVDRTIHDGNAKGEAIDILNNNHVIGIFPEGTTNPKNELLPFKYGAVSFAKKTNSYLLPFAIVGKYKLFRKNIKVVYGKPYKLNSDDLTKENNILRNKVIELKGKNNHDIFKKN